ncbi:MAG: FHA domain-containing protein [Planctomycetales bacterium]|nr:FHA domain-containing protein [Planctomycetales bacterium]
MKATLIVVEGAKPARVRLQLPTTIGRSERAKLKLRASLVSRTHCEIYQDGNELRIRDLGSSNGTKVNNERILQPTLLKTDDLIKIGAVVFRVLCDPNPSLADTVELVGQSDSKTSDSTPSESPNVKPAADAPLDIGDTQSDFDLEKPASETVQPASLDTADPAFGDFTSDSPNDDDVILAEAIDDAELAQAGPAVIRYEERDEGSVIHVEEAADFLRNLDTAPQAGESAIEELQDIESDRVEMGDSALDDFFKGLDD